ncbi:hypothetical protein [Cysteiniphilum litorale]|uniref:hypothetical protein n=1 Tax=Cysteiniphilum litorale TaxID=2056700 RepID=UPI003F8811AF
MPTMTQSKPSKWLCLFKDFLYHADNKQQRLFDQINTTINSQNKGFSMLERKHIQLQKKYPDIIKSAYDCDTEALGDYYRTKFEYCALMNKELQSLKGLNDLAIKNSEIMAREKSNLTAHLDDFAREKELKKSYKSDICQCISAIDTLTFEQFKGRYQQLIEKYNRKDFTVFPELSPNMKYHQEKDQLKSMLEIKAQSFCFTKDYTRLVNDAEKSIQDLGGEIETLQTMQSQQIDKFPQLKAFSSDPQKGVNYYRHLTSEVTDMFNQLDDFDECQPVTTQQKASLKTLYNDAKNVEQFIAKLENFSKGMQPNLQAVINNSIAEIYPNSDKENAI